MIIDDYEDCEVHQGDADATVADAIADTPTPLDSASVDVAPALSWIDPCANLGLALGTPTPLPKGALPVLGNQCAKPGWASPPLTVPLQLTDVTKDAGLATLSNVEPCILWQDFTGDALADVLVVRAPDSATGPRTVRVFPGQGDGTFGEALVTKFSSGSNAFHVTDCAPIDYDDDGYPDVAMSGSGGVLLWHNDSTGKFNDSTSKLMPFSATGVVAYSVSVIDFDRDGDLDLYAAMTGQLDLQAGHFACHPADGVYYQCCTGAKPYDDACLGKLTDPASTYTCCKAQSEIGAPNLLLRNDQDLGFVDVPTSNGAADPFASLTATVHDIDRDGWPDLFVGNDFGPLSWYRNNGKGGFAKFNTAIGLRPYGHVMGSAVADWNGDGWLDFVTADFGPSTLYLGSAKGFVNGSKDSGLHELSGDAVGWAMLALDLNNDGHEDLVGTQSLVASAKQLPAAVQGDASLYEPGYHVAYRNAGQGKLVPMKLPWAQGAAPATDSVVMAASDLEPDGDLDLVMMTPGGLLQVLRNDTPQPGHWLDLLLVADKSPQGGAGALVQVWSGGHVQEHWLQPTPGSGAHGDASHHFGLGAVTELDEVRVWWPSGKVSLVGKTKADQTLQVLESGAFGNTGAQPDSDAGPGGDTKPEPDAAPADTNAAQADPVPLDLTLLPQAKFTEITQEFGLTNSVGGKPLSHAYCAIGADMDGDGHDDVVVIESPTLGQYSVHAILRKEAGPKHVLTPIDSAKTVPAFGCNVADLNEDGKPDLLIGTETGLTVLQNQGEGDFLDKTEKYMPSTLNCLGWTVATGDLDGDQHLELLVGAGDIHAACNDVACGYVPGDFACNYVKTQPTSAGNQDRLLIPHAGQAFEDVTAKHPGLAPGGDATTVAFVDLDQDGHADVLIGNDFGGHTFLHNEGGKLVPYSSEIGFRPYAHLMGWGVGDFNRDGLLDLAAADAGPMLLYVQQPPKSGVPLLFENQALAAGLAAATWDTSSWNPLVADFDQDGWEDIFLGIAGTAPNGQLSALGVCIEPKLPVPQRDLWLHNQGDGTFAAQLAPKPESQASGFAAVVQSLLDADGDGDLDVLQVRRGGDVHLFRNDLAKPGTSILLRLRAKSGNTLAQGARVEAKVGGVTMVRQLVGNSGFGSPGQWSVHFGLGSAVQADSVTVKWPNGVTKNLGPVMAGKQLELQQP